MKLLLSIFVLALLSLLPAEGQVKGNMRLEIVNVPEEFKDLNKQVLLYHPTAVKKEKWPLVIYLHGSGGTKRGIEKMKWSGNSKPFLDRSESKYQGKVLVPQCKSLWNPAELNRMLDYILDTYKDIDPNRIYCVGFSMGGKGTWEWGMTSPDRFAAIVPMAFIPDQSKLEGMVKLPIWAMVGTRDSRKRTQGIAQMEKKLKELGSKALKISVFEGVNHIKTPGKAYAEAGLFEWIFSQSLPRK